MAQVHDLSKSTNIVNQFMAELRDKNIQTDRMRFKRNLERIGEIIAYEISKELDYADEEIITPLGEAQCKVIKDQPVLGTILRAGLPLHQGVANYFDKADNAFISAFRKHHKDDSFEIEIEYLSSPSVDGRVVILCDPMLATGASMFLAYQALLERGKPSKVYIAAAIASAEGVEYCKKHFPANTTFWIGAIDDELTAHAYIVPGLGDAGDLAYGEKTDD